ncbi:aconitate hydratase [bacterium I07]|nr:aconitate hydratase [bacterium I07]
MGQNVTQKLFADHLVSGKMIPDEEIALRIDHTLCQDATGTLVMLEFEAMQIPAVKTELSVQYVDHNLIQEDYKNPDDHLFLHSACKKFGIYFSRPGNGISHTVHMERFGLPGKTLLGSDSHSCSGGAIGMLAIGAGGLEVAMAMAGEPFYVKMPKVWGVKVTGKLPPWVSAKDVILEMLRRHGVSGGVGKVIEYYGPGLSGLSAMDRHVISNMGAELGATSTVFPSDNLTRRFLKLQQREEGWIPLTKDDDCEYDLNEEINLTDLEPLIACPGSPGNVVPVHEVAGKEIYQSYLGSSANSGFRDFALPALMVDGRRVHDRVSLDINPSSRQILENLIEEGYMGKLIHAGARLHQAGCNGCIGMGQAPATDKISLRTVPRNFPGRSGTKGDQVYLCSPETATASALTGVITDPRTLDFKYPSLKPLDKIRINTQMLVAPDIAASAVELEKGPNIKSLPPFDPLGDVLRCPVLLKVGDDISTDDIMPAGAKVLPFRSNIPEISKFVYNRVDDTYYDRAMNCRGGSVIIGGDNYGQGSSREHAALAPRYMGVRLVIVKSFARIHWQNLCNFGILPLTFDNSRDFSTIDVDDILIIKNVREVIQQSRQLTLHNESKAIDLPVSHQLSPRQIQMILEGSLISWMRKKK